MRHHVSAKTSVTVPRMRQVGKYCFSVVSANQFVNILLCAALRGLRALAVSALAAFLEKRSPKHLLDTQRGRFLGSSATRQPVRRPVQSAADRADRSQLSSRIAHPNNTCWGDLGKVCKPARLNESIAVTSK